MQAPVIDVITRAFGDVSTRRHIFRLVGGAVATGTGRLVGGPSQAKGKGHGKAKANRHGKGHDAGKATAHKQGAGKAAAKGKKGKITICYQQRTLTVKKKRYAKKYPGATVGVCPSNPGAGKHFSVSGRSILDASGNPVLLRGVNKMSLYDPNDRTGAVSFPEIAQTGANTVRIVWGIRDDTGATTSPSTLDALISTARANRLVPMIELHDATGHWAGMGNLVAYWTQPEIVAIIAQHQEYLLVNIGNEVGDETVTDAQFVAGYTNAVQHMRAAGIHTPLVIDAPEWGKKLETLNNTAATLLAADPDQNLIFSVHLYWGQADGADPKFIRDALQTAVAANYPLIVGEFSKADAYDPAIGDTSCKAGGSIRYDVIIEVCQQLGIGWYAWEWGPGNEYNPDGTINPDCAILNMTTDSRFATLQPGWATEVAVTSPFSIKNTANAIL